MFKSVPPGPPFYPTPLKTLKIKVLKTMPIWVFIQTQKSDKLPEAWKEVSSKLRLGSRSTKPLWDTAF